MSRLLVEVHCRTWRLVHSYYDGLDYLLKVPLNPGRFDTGQCFDCNSDWVYFHHGSSSVSLDGCSLDVAQAVGDVDKIPGLEVSRAGYVLEDFLDWFCSGMSNTWFTLHHVWQIDRALTPDVFSTLSL